MLKKTLAVILTVAALSPAAAFAQQDPGVTVSQIEVTVGSAISDGKPAIKRENPADKAVPLLPVVYDEPAPVKPVEAKAVTPAVES